jgi:hypothetical protein
MGGYYGAGGGVGSGASGGPGWRPVRARALVFPVILILVGGLFLYASWRPEFDAWRILGMYWPVILILLGLGRIWDNTRRGGPATQRYTSGGTIAVLVFVAVIALLLVRGRSLAHARQSSGGMQHTTRTVEAGGVKDVRASIEMPAGELTVSGGSATLLDARFDQPGNSGDPQVQYDHSSASGVLKISEGDSDTHVVFPSHGDRRWNLRFGQDVPLDLKIDMGAGQGNLNLRDVPLTKLELNIGAGQVNADLTGQRDQDLNADIEGGVGEADIRLPRNVGVMVEASGGIGSLDTDGLRKDGDRYVNAVYGKTPATIHLKVEGGIGHIILRLE